VPAAQSGNRILPPARRGYRTGLLVLKGGNCFRKAYFSNTRFSRDLDFATEAAVDETSLREEFNRVCDFAQAESGIAFDLERNRVELQHEIDSRRSVYEVKLYFKDFYGNPDKFTMAKALGAIAKKMDPGQGKKKRGTK